MMGDFVYQQFTQEALKSGARHPRTGLNVQGFALCFLIVCGLGCGSELPRGYIQHDDDLYPVQGIVRFEGQPAKNATIVFHRKGFANFHPRSDPNETPLNPRGDCDDSGKFEIYTYASGDGAPPGEYDVTVSWRDPEGTAREETLPELLPRRYQNPEESGLTARVTEEESNILPVFELTR